MSIPGLSIIGESINDSVPSTNALYESNDLDGIRELARFQESKGAAYIDVNVGGRSVEFMKATVEAVLSGTTLPLSIDSPDMSLAEVGLKACDDSRGKPILNSISPFRTEMFELYKVKPYRPILLISEYIDSDGESQASVTAQETFSAARSLFEMAKSRGIANSDIIFDPGIAPLGSDTEGHLERIISTLTLIRQAPDMAGVHVSVGLSNFTVMLPSKTRRAGLPVKGPLESAFLTLARPLGLDYIIGSVRRNYQLLDESHDAMVCLRDCMARPGFESLARVRAFYTDSQL